MDGNCIALRLCAMERPSEREKASPGGVSKYFKILQRKTPIGKYSIPHPYAPVKGLFGFFEKFF